MALGAGSRLRLAAGLAAGLALPSCGTTSDPVSAADVWTVLYSVELVGSGSVTRIQYDDGGGSLTSVASPVPGWNTTLFLPPGSTIALRGQAGLTEGRFRVTIDARAPSKPPIVRQKDCTGTTTACDLEIPRETLP